MITTFDAFTVGRQNDRFNYDTKLFLEYNYPFSSTTVRLPSNRGQQTKVAVKFVSVGLPAIQFHDQQHDLINIGKDNSFLVTCSCRKGSLDIEYFIASVAGEISPLFSMFYYYRFLFPINNFKLNY